MEGLQITSNIFKYIWKGEKPTCRRPGSSKLQVLSSVFYFNLNVFCVFEENKVKPWCSQDVAYSSVAFTIIQAKFGAIVTNLSVCRYKDVIFSFFCSVIIVNELVESFFPTVE